MLKACCLFFLAFTFSCVKQPSLLPKTGIDLSEEVGFYSFIFDFKTLDTLGNFEITLANSTFHEGETYKKTLHHIELEEEKLKAHFKEKNQIVDSMFFENPLYYRFEVFENEQFRTGVIQKEFSSTLLRVNSATVDEIQILKEDSIISIFKVQ